MRMQGIGERDSIERDRVLRAVEQMSHAVAVFDGDRRLVFINAAASSLLELPPEVTRRGTPMREFMLYMAKRGALGPNNFEEEYQRRIGTPRLQLEFERDDGAIIRVHREPLDNGGFVVMYTDVTEQRAAESALQRSELRYRSIVEDQTEYILRSDPDGVVTFANAACCEFHGVDRKGLIGTPMSALVHADDRAAFMGFFRQAVRDGPMREIEHRAKRRDGELRWLHRRDRAILDPDGGVIEYQSVARDISDMRSAEMQIRRASALAILGQMSAGVTHELNQPLNAASMIIQTAIMRMEALDDPTMPDYIARLGQAHDHMMRMGEIVNHLRNFIQSSSTGQVCPALRKLLEDAVNLVRHQLLIDEIDVRFDAPPTLPPVYGDEVQLEIVMANLLSNARAAILANRRAKGQEARARGRIMAIARPQGDTVQISIADNGGGIPAEVQHRIFDPFFTTKEVGEGMGLGLSLVYRIVTSLNGSVRAFNRVRGAVFTVSLPVWKMEGLRK